ncbi:MAG: DUF1638 domain-containing protein [Deltaproteobacteria bacterium]|nr:DUF1638 domain-containing protein [Deltaproteobacteria bacterium]
MSVGVICCRVLEAEMKRVVEAFPEVSHFEVMEWGLHIEPDLLLKTLIDRIRVLQEKVAAVVLGYGRCQILDKLPVNFKVPVFRPRADDCIGVLLGQERYQEALLEEGGTWFFTPGWTELGMEFIFHELQISRLGEKGLNPMQLARRMLKDFTRGLFVEVEPVNREALEKKAQAISETFGFRFEKEPGTLSLLHHTLKQAVESTGHGE